MECLGQLKQKRDCENRSLDDDKVGEAGADLEPGANVGDFGEENQTEAVAAQLASCFAIKNETVAICKIKQKMRWSKHFKKI